MSGISASTTSQPDHYVYPNRPPASTALWAHLLKRDTPGALSTTAIPTPPAAPSDKIATSMRVLLHDTQANFEKFSTRVDALITSINEAKQEMKSVQVLFERDRESLSNDIDNLVNRCQREIQKSIGTPSQAPEVHRLCMDIDKRLEGLDQRLDAMQMFNQIHSQTLQTQTQALQNIQDQQATIVAAVMPLLPLVQSIPLHIDAAKTYLTEISQKTAPEDLQHNSPVALINSRGNIKSTPSKVKRPFTHLRIEDSSPSSMTTAKKPRTDQRQLPGGSPSPIRHKAVDRPVPQTISSLRPNRRTISVRSQGLFPLVQKPVTVSSSSRQNSMSLFSTIATPRRPLSDLGYLNNTPIPPQTKDSTGYLPKKSKVGDLEIQSSNQNFEHSESTVSDSAFGGENSTCATMVEVLSMDASGIDMSMLNVEDSKGITLAKTVTDDTLISPSSMISAAAPSIVTCQANSTRQRELQNLSEQRYKATSTGRHESTTTLDIASGRFNTEGLATIGHAPTVALPVGKLRKRRSPPRQGRRFIPLLDSEDSEDGDQA